VKLLHRPAGFAIPRFAVIVKLRLSSGRILLFVDADILSR
jgi:hypothetical protein